MTTHPSPYLMEFEGTLKTMEHAISWFGRTYISR